MNRSSRDTASVPGLVYSRPDGRPVRGRCWRFWYLQRSKRVWFRLPDTVTSSTAGAQVWLCRYNGRPILHRAESPAWIARGETGATPVLWGKWPELGVGLGPQGTNLYLGIWTRWSWLHPEACSRPELFSVEAMER